MTDENLEIDDTLPAVITPHEILSLRRSGMPRPKQISTANWLAPAKLNSQHELIAYMTASGTPRAEICTVTGLSSEVVGRLLKSGRMEFRIKEIQFQLYGKEPKKRFEALMGKSFQALNDLLDSDTVKPATKLNAANTVFDRVMGKPTQAIEVRDSTLMDFYKLLDQKFGGPQPIEAEFTSAIPGQETTIKEKETVDIDAWLDENL